MNILLSVFRLKKKIKDVLVVAPALVNCGDALTNICVTNKVKSMLPFFGWILDFIQMLLSLCTMPHKPLQLPDFHTPHLL
jgi:hypothetical protein